MVLIKYNIIKFADDTTVVGPVSGDDEMAYRDEVQHLAVWCGDHHGLQDC